MKHFILILTAITLAACAAQKEEIQPTEPQKKNIEPLVMDFSQSEVYAGSVNARIASDGDLTFYAFSELGHQLVLQDFNLKTSECDASQVKYQMIWFPVAPTDGATTGYVVGKNSRLPLAARTKGALAARLQNVQNCAAEFSVTLKRIPLPQATEGYWTSNYNAPSEPYHVMKLSIWTVGDVVQSIFQTTCDSTNLEKVTADLVYNNETELPKKMIFKVSKVDQAASASCAKQFGLRPGDEGKLIYCIHNKSAVGSVFNLACRVSANGLNYPSSYGDVSTTWTKNN